MNNELKELKVDAAEMCLVQLDGNDVYITVARGTSVFCAVTFNQMLILWVFNVLRFNRCI